MLRMSQLEKKLKVLDLAVILGYDTKKSTGNRRKNFDYIKI